MVRMKLEKRNTKSNTLNRGLLEPVDVAKWPMYSDCGSLISVMCLLLQCVHAFSIDQFLSDRLVFLTIKV